MSSKSQLVKTKQWLKYCIICFIRLPGLTKPESLENICDVQDSVEDASRQLAFFFPNYHASEVEHNTERTLAIIRPSLLKEKRGKC